MSGNSTTSGGPARNTRRNAPPDASQQQSSGADDVQQADNSGGDEGEPANVSPQGLPSGASGSGAAGQSNSGGVDVAAMMRQMQAMEQHIQRLEQQQQPPQQSFSLGASSSPVVQVPAPPAAAVNDIAALLRAMQESQAMQAEQMRKQQAVAASQQLVLRTLGELPSFSGKGSDTTLVAEEWLKRAERYFAIREQALGISAAEGDESRLLSAAYALQDDARRWYDALPHQPTTWTEFRVAIKARFCSVPSERIRVDKLREFVEKAARLRDKLNVQGMQVYTARFLQLAGEVSDSFLTGHGKLELLARGLPQRYAEVVLKEDAKDPLPPLHEVVNIVLARASQKEQAAAYGNSSSSPASAAPLNLDAVSLAVATFGWTREEAKDHLDESEGWAPHDTNAAPPQRSAKGPASAATSSPTSSEALEQLIINTIARVGAGPAARDRQAGGAQSRRNAPTGVAKEVPQELFEARKKAGLCCKCGVVKYEPGGKGHNSVTCKAPIDKTTSAAEGLKKANF